MNVLIVDDEPLARTRLIRLLNTLNPNFTVKAAHDGHQALEQLNHFTADIIILDIQMPTVNGLSLAQQIQVQFTPPPAIVFCSAHDEFALEAFNVNAQGYLVKPVSLDNLKNALLQATAITQAQITSSHTSDIETFSVSQGRFKQKIPLDDVYYLKAQEKAVILYCQQGSHILDDSLKVIEQKYADKLYRIHRNTLINPRFIDRIYRDTQGKHWVNLQNVNQALAVSRRHVKSLQKKWIH